MIIPSIYCSTHNHWYALNKNRFLDFSNCFLLYLVYSFVFTLDILVSLCNFMNIYCEVERRYIMYHIMLTCEQKSFWSSSEIKATIPDSSLDMSISPLGFLWQLLDWAVKIWEYIEKYIKKHFIEKCKVIAIKNPSLKVYTHLVLGSEAKIYHSISIKVKRQWELDKFLI